MQRDYNSKERLTKRLVEVQEAASKHGGLCISKEYVHVLEDLEFVCKVHNIFFAKPKHILQGHWCEKCRNEARKPDVVERLNAYVELKGGKLNSTYINARTHVTIECPIHGEWPVTPDNLLNKKSWCKRCAMGKPRGKRK